ncbi:MAG: hypothetical protein A4E71_02348 [Smithella sp. PtaU1.Bin162]|nr:MAG: hypothetical protein A4E71_02348 [Smithella sp. PtaU1.Bin162]
MNNLHAPPPQHIRRTHHERIPDTARHLQCLGESARHARCRHGNTQLIHHLAETVTVFGKINRFRRSADYFYTGFRQIGCNVERRLTAELHNYTFRFLFFVNTQNIFHRKRLKVKFIRCIVIRRNCFRIAVDHDGFNTFITQSKSRVDTAIVKFNSLPDPVGTAA